MTKTIFESGIRHKSSNAHHIIGLSQTVINAFGKSADGENREPTILDPVPASGTIKMGRFGIVKASCSMEVKQNKQK
jgi:hypothetical protein